LSSLDIPQVGASINRGKQARNGVREHQASALEKANCIIAKRTYFIENTIPRSLK